MKKKDTIQQPIAPSEGISSILNESYTTFRVWAPNANKVFVTGDFNSWSEDDLELSQEENGYWAGTYEKAKEVDPGPEK